MHQPEYRDPETGHATLPWVRLHATKDYLDMAALAGEHPGVPQTFNLTPVLLDQLEALDRGEPDLWFDLAMKSAESLSESEALFLVRNFFMANWERLVDPIPRYRELLELRGRSAPERTGPADAARFSTQDLRDLAVLFLLAWTDERWIEEDPALTALRARGAPFREDDKAILKASHRAIIGRIVPFYRDLAARGVLELTCSPHFHPISPLLIDQACAHEARPAMALPTRMFQGERDAAWQLDEALRTHEARFGGRPAGVWPSEGGISEAFVELAAARGIRWLASGEGVLTGSLHRGGQELPAVPHGRPWRYDSGKGPVHLLFRDHYLSDLIGFVYARWSAEHAAADFVEKVKAAGRAAGEGSAPPLISVILDGENAWETYERDGRPFLEAVYRVLANDPEIECVTPSGYLERFGASTPRLHHVLAGSWINSDFGVWMGQADDRRAWEFLADARGALLTRESALPKTVFDAAWRHLMAAEGSDWNWWYGTEHYTPLAAEFDQLFRRHLIRMYRIADVDAPAILFEPIIHAAPDQGFIPPSDFVSVLLDGRVSNYYEWLSAGRYESSQSGSAMHRLSTLVEGFRFGADRSGNLFFRLDLNEHREVFEHAQIVLRIAAPVEGDCVFDLTPAGWQCLFDGPAGGVIELKAACVTIFEAMIRFSPELARQAERRFCVVLRDRATGRPLEQWPPDGFLTIATPERGEFTESWVV